MYYAFLNIFFSLSRADSSIEVWNLHHNAAIERVLPGRPNGSVEALAWCSDRLFSTGISARVVEYDLKTLTVKVCNSLLTYFYEEYAVPFKYYWSNCGYGTALFFLSVLDVSNCWPSMVSWSKSEEDMFGCKYLTPMILSHLL